HPRPKLGDAVDDELPAHPRNRVLPRGIDLRHTDDVRPGQRLAEPLGEVKRPRIEMRLEEGEDPALFGEPAGGLEGRGDLGGVVAVVVEEANACDLARLLKAPTRAAEL